jgi:hypothetical protein
MLAEATARINVFPVDATLPLPEVIKPANKSTSTSREALYLVGVVSLRSL